MTPVSRRAALLLPLALLLGACSTQNKSGTWALKDAERMLDVVSRDHSAKPFAKHPEPEYIKCVAAEIGRRHTPAEVNSLPRLVWDVVRAEAYLACQDEIKWDADGENKADEVFKNSR